MKEYVILILNSLRNRKMRALLTTLGVVIGVTLIIILISLGQGMQNSIDEQFQKIGIKAIRIVPGSLTGPPSGAFGLDKDLQTNIEKIRGVDYVNPVLMNDDIIIYNDEGVSTSIIGYDSKLSDKGFADTDISLQDGRFFEVGEKNVVLIGYKIAEEAFTKKIRVKNSIEIRNIKFKVIGVFEKTGTELDNRVYIPLETAREVFNQKTQVNVFTVQVKDGFDPEAVALSIKKELIRVLKSEDAFQVFTPAQLIAQIQSILGVISLILLAIASISILVGAIGIMNSMYTSVLERTREIGIMKSIGAKKSHILLLFLIEAGIIGLAGGIVGSIIGSIISILINFIIGALGYGIISITVDPYVISFALAFSFIVGALSGLFPALRASNMQPVDTLRYE